MLYVDPLSQHRVSAMEPATADRAKEKQALEEFERLFLYQMLKAMRKSVSRAELFGGASQRETYEEMLDDVWAGQMAKSGQLGVAKILETDLRLQESQGALAAERRAARDAAGLPGLPLETPRANRLPLEPPPPGPLPVPRRNTTAFDAPWIRPGIPFGVGDFLSNTTPVPINNVTGPEALRPGAGGFTP